MFTDVCLLGEQESEILQRLIDSLRNRVRCVDCFVTKINPETDRLYNIIICLHENMIDEESQLISFGTLLDVNRQVCTDNYLTLKLCKSGTILFLKNYLLVAQKLLYKLIFT